MREKTISFGQVSNEAIDIGANTLVNDSTFYGYVNITNYGTLDALIYKGAPVDVTIESTGVDLNGTLDGAVYENVYGLASGVVVEGGILYGEAGGTITNAKIESATIEELLPGSKSYNTYNDNGEVVISGTANGDIIDGNYKGAPLGAFEYDKAGGVSNNATAINAGIIIGYAGAIINNPVLDIASKATIDSNATLNGALINGGMIVAEKGATIKGEITFGSGGGTLKNSGAHNLTIAGFTSGDEIFLSGTSIPKSKHVTLGSKGVLTIGSIKETFVHGAGMVLNLTSTSSGVEITEKSAPADTSAASSSSAGISESVAKASPDIAAKLWNNPKMEFLGTALTDNPTSEMHLDNANFALLLRDDFNEADIIGLKGAASSELTLTHPTTSAGAHITTLPLQTSIFSITTFSLG